MLAKRNLNVGTMINGNQNQEDNGTIEKYCYDNNSSHCDTYGGLYQWNEIMQHTTTPGLQGICPPDWHIPTNEEWKQLEGETDSQYGYPDPEWDIVGWRGFDAGLNLKATSGWSAGGNGIDLYGLQHYQEGAEIQVEDSVTFQLVVTFGHLILTILHLHGHEPCIIVSLI